MTCSTAIHLCMFLTCMLIVPTLQLLSFLFMFINICDIHCPGIIFVCSHVKMHVTDVNIRNMEHVFLRNIHVRGSNIHVTRSWLVPVYSRPQKQEHHWTPTVPTYGSRQSPKRNTLMCASRTNNTYTFLARPRKVFCQSWTSPKSHCPPAPW